MPDSMVKQVDDTTNVHSAVLLQRSALSAPFMRQLYLGPHSTLDTEHSTSVVHYKSSEEVKIVNVVAVESTISWATESLVTSEIEKRPTFCEE